MQNFRMDISEDLVQFLGLGNDDVHTLIDPFSDPLSDPINLKNYQLSLMKVLQKYDQSNIHHAKRNILGGRSVGTVL